MKYRLWYHQLDIYDAMRRICLLLEAWNRNPQVSERLYIADFYLANPSLLHKASMPQCVRVKFGKLNVIKPDKMFINLPSSQTLFFQMESVQRQALATLMGKNLVQHDVVKSGNLQLSESGLQFYNNSIKNLKTELEIKLINFLCNHYIIIKSDNIQEIRKRTALRRQS